MAKSSSDDNITPESSDTADLGPASDPMIIDGRVVNGAAASTAVPAHLTDNLSGSDDEAPVSPPRNGIAMAALFVALASLLRNPFGLLSLLAIITGIMGLRRAIAIYREKGVMVGRMPATIGVAIGVASTVLLVFGLFAASSAT